MNTGENVSIIDSVSERISALCPKGDWKNIHLEPLYAQTHELFNSPEYANLSYHDFSENSLLYQRFDAVRKNDIDAIRTLCQRNIVASVTTYPARIGSIARALDSILSQTIKPDTILVQLFKGEFPNGEDDIPADLKQLVEQGKVAIDFCEENLRSHLKYFYTMQSHPEDVVITIDDDIVYRSNLFEHLWLSYLQFPYAISSARSHLITFSEDEHFLPYSCWPVEIEIDPFRPSMRLFATGVGGVLYPPHLLPEYTFDSKRIKELCLAADDVWLKLMEVAAGIPVVIADPIGCDLSFVPNTQSTGLFHANVNQCGNDVQLNNVVAYLENSRGFSPIAQLIIHSRYEEGFENTIQCYTDYLCRQTTHVKSRLISNRNAAIRERNALRREVDQARQALQAKEDELAALRSSKAYVFGTAIAKPYRAVIDRLRGIKG